jgi:hypothetical protein
MSPTQSRTRKAEDELQEQVGDDDAAVAARDSGERRRARRRERASETASRVNAERLEQAREIAGEMRHKRQCPEEGALPGDEDTRVEFFPSNKPRSLDLPEEERGKRLIVVRCIECGESEVDDDKSEA